MSTRHDRKEAQKARWRVREQNLAQMAQAVERFAREHPVLSGRVPVVDYQEPPWRYVRPGPVQNPIPLKER